jgi:hypothetical protein
MFGPITIKVECIGRPIAHTDEEQSRRRPLEIDFPTALEAKMGISPRDKLEGPFFSLAEQLRRVFLCRVDKHDARCFSTRDELVMFQVQRVPIIALASFPLSNVSNSARECSQTRLTRMKRASSSLGFAHRVGQM